VVRFRERGRKRTARAHFSLVAMYSLWSRFYKKRREI